MVIQISQKIIIRDSILFINKNSQIHQEKIKPSDIDIWICTKSLNGTPIKERNVTKLKNLKKGIVTQFISKPKTETKKPKTKQSIPIEKLKIVIVKTPTLHININNSLLLTPIEFINFVHHAISKEPTTTTKYKLTKTQIILHSSPKKKIQIDEKIVKKAYQNLIDMGIKIPIHLKNEIDAIYRWQ